MACPDRASASGFALLKPRHPVNEVGPLKEVKGHVGRLPDRTDPDPANDGSPGEPGRLGLFGLGSASW
ncbi:hypothetical protein LZ519_09220 [Sphingomonas sp. RG327]|uniref:Uncharacterized protein n=1 Tax=Sphingomonas anseongensis TaxID=2908207 RepID=A0ABT0RGV3_9SPHN|nr:hypothetical protein [Sphingomonas anseongensis]MCL6679489.1 hypothetical protein [Sphingomonas anseongensis]